MVPAASLRSGWLLFLIPDARDIAVAVESLFPCTVHCMVLENDVDSMS